VVKIRKINRWIDLSPLPKYKQGNRREVIDWNNVSNIALDFIYGDIKNKITILKYIPNEKRVLIEYKNNFYVVSRATFYKCSFGKIFGGMAFNFEYDIGSQINDDKRNYILTDRKLKYDTSNSLRKCYKYTCNICGANKQWIYEYEIQRGTGCSICSHHKIEEGINDIPTKALWMAKYFQGGYDEAKLYSPKSNKKICFKCPDCGKIKEKPIMIEGLYRDRSIACSCGDKKSYPHKFMRSVLTQLKITFTEEYSPSWLEKKSFDFYLPEQKLIIEVDGIGHGKQRNPWTKQTPIESWAIDCWKDEQATNNGLFVLRIDADESTIEYLKPNIIFALERDFDLDNIDWDECDRYAMKNLAEEICLYYESNHLISSKQVATIFNVSVSTANRYLKKGAKYGWCSYNPSRSMKKINGKRIAVYKDDKLIAVYDTVRDLAQMSINDFGIKFNKGSISIVARGIWKHYKHYSFKYIDKNENKD
jgi:transposase